MFSICIAVLIEREWWVEGNGACTYNVHLSRTNKEDCSWQTVDMQIAYGERKMYAILMSLDTELHFKHITVT